MIHPNRLTILAGIPGFLAAALMLAGPAHAGPEQRCSELGSHCVCSEPMNISQAIPAGQGTNIHVDPADSPTASECPGEAGNGSSFYASGGGAAIPEFGMPGGNDVDWVWRVDGGGIANLTGQTTSFSQGTLCTRIYQRFSPDIQYGGGNQRLKLMEQSGSFLAQMQISTWSPYVATLVFVGHGLDMNLPVQGSTVSFQDFQSEWVRTEECMGVANGNGSFRARVVGLTSGKVMSFVSPTFSANQVDVSRLWIGNLFRQNSSQGHRYVSHGMQAFWPTHEGQWIGGAYEVEGSNWVEPEAVEIHAAAARVAAPGPAPPGGEAALSVSIDVVGATATATSTVTNGIGPFQFLFDCGDDGHWEGVVDTGSGQAAYSCSTASGSVRAWMWDQGHNQVIEQVHPFSTMGPPGVPVILN